MLLSNKNGEGELRASCLSSPWARPCLKRQRFACLLKCTGELMASVVNSPEARYRLGSDFSLCSMRRAQGDLIGLALGSLSSRFWPLPLLHEASSGRLS
ncbi:hypothetical protein LWI29_021795 [Acer saccharum]|uniref:Uncharacterized protein n=1 Tax=Acer saccharum TaxID=4024 RepID=A0AA39VDX6_ACESA|nr:hypothetical protein LWI29_021795 [Acer saccharum]